MVAPHELKKRTFTKSVRGYNVNEVDDYFTFVFEKYTEAYNEYAELERKIRLLAEKLDQARTDEDAIKATIVNAQKMADAIIQDANQKAADITGAINDSCEEIIAEYRERAVQERNKLIEVEQAVSEFKNSLFDAYREHLNLIHDILPEDQDEQTAVQSEDELVDEALLRAKGKMQGEDEARQEDEDIRLVHEHSEEEILAPDLDSFDDKQGQSQQ